MFTQELEQQLVELANANPQVNYQTQLNDIIAKLPEKNSQGEIKAEIDGLLATVEVTDEFVLYVRTGDKPAQKDGLLIKFSREGKLLEYSAINYEDGSHTSLIENDEEESVEEEA